jgi:uncharacterized protein involved in type VI secretion and phage assembly
LLSRLISLFQEKVENRYYGKYRGIVESNEDGKHMGRLLVKVPSIMGDKVIGWAMPCFPYGGGQDRGVYMVPEKDDGVWVEFEAGNLSYPVWSGVWHAKDETPKGVENASPEPALKIIKSKSGNILQMSDAEGSESISLIDKSGNKIVMKSESLSVTDKSGNKVTMSASSVEVDAGTRDLKLKGNNVSIEATTELKLKGMTVSVEGSGAVTIKGATVDLNP